MSFFSMPIPWPTFWILFGLAIVMLVLITLHVRSVNDYDFFDLLMSGTPRKSDLDKHILVGFALLSVWYVIMLSLDVDDRIPERVDSLLLGVLGFFIAGRAAAYGIRTAGAAITRKAEITRGRRDDEDGEFYVGSDRRALTGELEDERPPGASKRGLIR